MDSKNDEERSPADNFRSDMLAERTSGVAASRSLSESVDAFLPLQSSDAESASYVTVASMGPSTHQSRSASAGIVSERRSIDDRYRVVDGFLYGVEPMHRNDILDACPRLVWQMADDAWRPEVIELEFGDAEKRPLPDYYYISMKTQVPGAATINRKRK